MLPKQMAETGKISSNQDINRERKKQTLTISGKTKKLVQVTFLGLNVRLQVQHQGVCSLNWEAKIFVGADDCVANNENIVHLVRQSLETETLLPMKFHMELIKIHLLTL